MRGWAYPPSKHLDRHTPGEALYVLIAKIIATFSARVVSPASVQPVPIAVVPAPVVVAPAPVVVYDPSPAVRIWRRKGATDLPPWSRESVTVRDDILPNGVLAIQVRLPEDDTQYLVVAA